MSARSNRPVQPVIVWAELAMTSALILSFIWLWQDTFAQDSVVFGLAILALVISGHARRRETPRTIGFRWDNLTRAGRLVAVFVGPLILLTLAAGAWSNSYRFPPLVQWPAALGGLFIWGVLQQYVLLAFFYRRFSELVMEPVPLVITTASVYTHLHLPNPLLVCVTFVGGVIACGIYRRVPNLLTIGLAHCVLSFCFYYALPRTITFGLRIGWAFWEY